MPTASGIKVSRDERSTKTRRGNLSSRYKTLGASVIRATKHQSLINEAKESQDESDASEN